MVKFLPSAVAIFIILCFACVLNDVDANPASNNGDSPKDSDDVVFPVSSSKSSSGRIRPSAWSKEEKGDLKPNNDKNKQQDILPDEESSLWNMKKLFRYVASFLYAANQNSDDSVDKSIDDLKFMMQNLANNDPLEQDKSKKKLKDEMQNSSNSETLDKSLDDAKMQNRLNNRQPTENSKNKVQNLTNTDILNKSKDDREMRNTANDNPLKKSSNEAKVQKSTNNDFPNDKQSTGSSKSKTDFSTDKDFMAKSEINKKTETQNLESSDTLNKSVTDEDIQNFATNNTLNKSSDNKKMQKSLNRNSSDSTQQAENSKNNQQNVMNKDHLNTLSQAITMQNSSNNDIQLESIPAVKNDTSKDVTKIEVKDYEDCDNDKAKVDDCTINNTPEEGVNEQVDDIDDEEDADDTVENDMDEDEKDMDEVENDMDEDENDMDEVENDIDEVENDMDEDENEDDYIKDTNIENDTNENDVESDHVKENNYSDGDKLGGGNPNPQSEVAVGKKAHDRSIILPKFISKATQDQQNYSETQPPRSQFGSNDNVTLEDAEFQNMPNEEKPSPEFQLSSSEFIDDYINNPQRKTPERENKQPNTTEVLSPNGNDTKSKIIPIQIPILNNNFEEDNRSLYATPPVNENMIVRNMYFDQSQDTGGNLLSEKNARPPLIFNEGRKDSTPNKDFLDNTFPQNLKNTPSSADKPVFSTHDDGKVDKITPLNLFPFHLKPQSNDLQHNLVIPQEDYNVFSEPAALEFPNINFPIKTPHNDIPATNIYRPESIVPIQMSSNKALENERYFNDQYEKYNFQDEKSPGISNEKVQQFEQYQPIILQQDIFPNIQYISKQGTPNTPNETTYFTNYQPEIPVNIPNIEKPTQNTKSLPNYLISDALHSNPPFNDMYNQDSSPTNIGNSMDKIRSQGHSDAAKPQNQINIDKTLDMQNDLVTFQNNFSEQQIQFPQNDIKTPLSQSEMNNKALPYESKMISEIFPAQDESKNTEFPQTQNGTNSSKGPPHYSFSNTEEIQIKPKNQDSSPVISENTAEAKPLVKSSKHLIDEHQKSTNFHESRGQEQRTSSSDSDFSNNGRSYKTSSHNYGVEYDEDESEESKTLSDEIDNEENEVDDDFVSENNYSYEDSTNEDEHEDDYLDENDEDDYADENDEDDYADENDEDDYADENDEDEHSDENDKDDYADENDQDDYADENDQDDYADENNYDDDETKTDSNAQKPKKEVTAGERTHESTTVSPKRMNQTISDHQNHSMTKSPKSQINNNDVAIPKTVKSHSITNEENSSPRSELISDEFNDDYMNKRFGENSKKENGQVNPSDETIKDATMQITQKSISGDANDAIEPPETFNAQSEPASSNQGENFNTILEYIYKYSNNLLFKGIRDKEN